MLTDGKQRALESPKGAMTLVEILIAFGIFLLLIVAAYMLLGQAWRQDDRIQEHLESEQQLRLKLHRLVSEVREARKIFLPVVAKATVDGIGIVNDTGESIVYYHGGLKDLDGSVSFKPVMGATGGLYRTNVNKGLTECLLKNVSAFRVTLYPAMPGQEPSCVAFYLAVKERKGKKGAAFVHDAVTRVFLRNFDRTSPDE